MISFSESDGFYYADWQSGGVLVAKWNTMRDAPSIHYHLVGTGEPIRLGDHEPCNDPDCPKNAG